MATEQDFEQIVREHGAMIKRIASSYEADAHLTEELVQNPPESNVEVSTKAGQLQRREYKRSDFPKGFVRGKYASRLRAGSNIVRLDPEIASAFPTSEAVNEALSAVLKAAKNARVSKKR